MTAGSSPRVRSCLCGDRRSSKKGDMLPSSPKFSPHKIVQHNSVGQVMHCENSILRRSPRLMGSGKENGKSVQLLRRSPRLSALKLDPGSGNPKTHQGNLAPCEGVSEKSDSLKVIQRRCSRKNRRVANRKDKNEGISSVVGNGYVELAGESRRIRVRTRSLKRSWSPEEAQFRNGDPGSDLQQNTGQSVVKIGMCANVSEKFERKVKNRHFNSCKYTGASTKQNSEAASRRGECQNYKDRLRNLAEITGERKKEEGVMKEDADFGIKIMEAAKCCDKTVTLNVQQREGNKNRKREGNNEKSRASDAAIKQCKSGHLPCGWTEEQEAALSKAYFSAKPTPHFWKKVAKMVPGKTSQECFDRVHCNLPTPQQSQSRYKKGVERDSPLSHFSLSDSKLLEPINLNIMRTQNKQQKTRMAQKTVRRLLRKHQLADQGYETDLFSVLEDRVDPTTPIFLTNNMFSTPGTMAKSFMFLQKCQKSSSSEKYLISPPVLKRVKNMALHEKFIDQLHCREARRKRTSNQAGNASSSMGGNNENELPKADVKAAKNALVSNATDIIRSYKQMQEVCILEDEAERDEDELEEEI